MFEQFPKRWFIDLDGEYQLMTNICRKFKIPESIKNNQSLYLEYYMRDGDTARSLATRIYDDSEMFWLIYLANNIKNPAEEWPKSDEQLSDWLIKKYTLSGMYKTKHYTNQNGDIVDLHALKAFDNTLSTSDSDIISRHSLIAVSYDKYHRDINDRRRNLRLIDPDHADAFKKALEDVFNEDQ